MKPSVQKTFELRDINHNKQLKENSSAQLFN